MKYDINPELFFQLDEAGRRRHDQQLFKKRFRLDVRKYVFSKGVIDNWNMLLASCSNCSTISTFKKHRSSALESESLKCVSCDSRCNTVKACAYSCQHHLRHAGIVEFGEFDESLLKLACFEGVGLLSAKISDRSPPNIVGVRKLE